MRTQKVRTKWFTRKNNFNNIKKMLRYLVIGFAAILTSLPLVTNVFARSDNWPSKPVTVVVPASPGGNSGPLARLVSAELAKELGQPFVVENKPGANGNIGAAHVADARPDGYTILFSWNGTLTSAVTLYDSKPFDPVKDFNPVVLLGSVPNVIVTSKTLPVSTLKELTEYVKQHPGELSFGSTGTGSSWHLSGELYKKVANVELLHVPYTASGTVINDLIPGRLEVLFPGLTSVNTFVRDGRITALAVMANERSELLPTVPTTRELGFTALESSIWFGLLTPKGTPGEINLKLNTAVNKVLNNPIIRRKMIDMGYNPMGGTQNHFANYMNEEIAKWRDIVRYANVKVE